MEFKEPDDLTDKCEEAFYDFGNATAGLNVYDIYGKCYKPPKKGTNGMLQESEEKYGHALVGGELKRYKRYATPLDYTPWLKETNPALYKTLKDLPPCTFGEPII
jgi:hypothetical protein